MMMIHLRHIGIDPRIMIRRRPPLPIHHQPLRQQQHRPRPPPIGPTPIVKYQYRSISIYMIDIPYIMSTLLIYKMVQ